MFYLLICKSPCIIVESEADKAAIAEGLAVKVANGDAPRHAPNLRILKVNPAGNGYGSSRSDEVIRLMSACEYAKNVMIL